MVFVVTGDPNINNSWEQLSAQPRTQLPDKLLCSTKNLKAVGGRTPRTAPHGRTKDSQFLRYHSFCLFLAKTADTKLQQRAVALIRIAELSQSAGEQFT